MNAITKLCKENGATILTGLGVAGVVSTAVMTAKATPKALDILADKQEYKQEHYGEPLTRFEKLLAVIPPYLPAILMGTATTACILGANHLNKVRQADLLAAYACLDATFKEYQAKVKDIFGEAGEKKVREELEKERFISEKYGDPSEKKLFYDKFSNRYFEMSTHELLKAIYDANRMYNYLGELKLNDLYEYLGLKKIDIGETLGWNAQKDWECYGFSWIEVRWEQFETPDNLEAFVIQFEIDPAKDYEEWKI